MDPLAVATPDTRASGGDPRAGDEQVKVECNTVNAGIHGRSGQLRQFPALFPPVADPHPPPGLAIGFHHNAQLPSRTKSPPIQDTLPGTGGRAAWITIP